MIQPHEPLTDKVGGVARRRYKLGLRELIMFLKQLGITCLAVRVKGTRRREA
jgi:hypothetical protein